MNCSVYKEFKCKKYKYPWKDAMKDKYDHHNDHKKWKDFTKDEYDFYKDHKPWNFNFSQLNYILSFYRNSFFPIN